jgi:lincosamide nucleotidyltransferase A/C/D/E
MVSDGLRLRRLLRAPPVVAVRSVLPESVVEFIRRKLFSMPKDEAARVVSGLFDDRVPFVLAGGWGVDALTGEFKRQHSDLDVIVAPGALGALVSTLVVLGYVLTEESVEGGWWAPDTSVFRNGRGRRIEALLLTAEQLAPLARRAEAMLGHRVDVTPVTGSVGGVEVSCLSPALQLAAHDGFELNHHQQRDFRLLDALARE